MAHQTKEMLLAHYWIVQTFTTMRTTIHTTAQSKIYSEAVDAV